MLFKIVTHGYAKEGMSKEEYMNYWLNKHAPLVKRLFGDKIKKYVVSIVVSTEGEEPGYQGTTEIWVDNMSVAQSILSSPEFKQQIMPDHANFARKVTWVILEEHVFV